MGGANQSAVGELAMGEVFYRRMRACLQKSRSANETTFRVPRGCASRAAGQRRKNTARLCSEFGLRRIRIFEDASLQGYQVQHECIILDKNA